MEYTKETAKRIAGYGANKMDTQGYTYEKWAVQTTPEPLWNVFKPATETEEADVYFVAVWNDGAFTSCNCPFHKANGYCKHAERISRLQKDEAEAEAGRAGEAAEVSAVKVGAGRFDTIGDPYTSHYGYSPLAKAYAHDADLIDAQIY